MREPHRHHYARLGQRHLGPLAAAPLLITCAHRDEHSSRDGFVNVSWNWLWTWREGAAVRQSSKFGDRPLGLCRSASAFARLKANLPAHSPQDFAKFRTLRGNGQAIAKNRRFNPMHSLPQHQASRCRARSKRSGKPCQSPAVRGCSVCQVHGAGGGAPKATGTP